MSRTSAGSPGASPGDPFDGRTAGAVTSAGPIGPVGSVRASGPFLGPRSPGRLDRGGRTRPRSRHALLAPAVVLGLAGAGVLAAYAGHEARPGQASQRPASGTEAAPAAAGAERPLGKPSAPALVDRTGKPRRPAKGGPAGAGSAPIGSTAYHVPARAIFVARSGDDRASGRRGASVATIRRAVAMARDGDTIVVRAGTYHESVELPAGKRLTLQAYPHESVWLDGSSAVQGWNRDGTAWRHDGWKASFDSSQSYTAGAKAGADEDFRFVDPAYPMAAHPDQVWIGGVPLRQVGSRAAVRTGTFYVDDAADRLYVGSDPTRREVRACDLGQALTIRSAGSVVRGIGIHRYATSLPDIAAVRATAPGVTIENVVVTDTATTGLSALARDITFRHVTAKRNGMLGIHANYADRLRLDSVRTETNNTEHFKSAPVSGGIKVTRSRTVSLVDSVSRGNLGKGVWMDESVHGITLTGNDISGNSSHGISLELSAKALVADNVIRDNAGDGIRLNDTGNAQIWNNTLSRNGRSLHLVQDDRRASDPSAPGHDPRQKLPDPSVPWLVRDITIGNNAISQPRIGADCLLCVEDHTHERTAAQMRVIVDGNVYTRTATGAPIWLVVWSRGGRTPATYTTLHSFRVATGQERHGLSFERSSAVARSSADLSTAARPLPGPVAQAVDRPAGERHIGTWR